jgi:23S rRNA pseudouridine1911/1915/1917 synthase
MVTVSVPESHATERADKALASLLGVSRSVARAIVETGSATVDGIPVRASEKLSAGMVLEVILPETAARMHGDASVPFEVIHVDDHLVVIDKPIGVVVHSGAGRTEGTLAHGLLARFPDIEGVGQADRWGIVHRLDRDTSGLLVVARTVDAYGELTAMLKRRAISRRYLSLVRGDFANTTGTIDAPIGRDSMNRTRMRVSRDGRPSRTHYRKLAGWESDDVTLLSVTLETGRTHQIRVHMQAIDHSIVGDKAYGRSGGTGDPGRPWLHARELSFTHPITSEDLDFVSPLPPDLSDSLSALGEPGDGAVTDVGGVAL